MRPNLAPHTEPFQVLDHGFVRLVDCMGGDEDIEAAARLSFNQGTRSVDERRKLIRYLMRQKHSSPFEQVVIKLEMKLPIFVARQLVRHRTQALNEVSARYSVLPDEVYIPAPERVQAQSTANKQGSGAALDGQLAADFVEVLQNDCKVTREFYDSAIQQGIARETARIGLPVNTYTRWVTTMSAHNLLHLLQLRLDEHAQWETRQYAEAIAKIVADADLAHYATTGIGDPAYGDLDGGAYGSARPPQWFPISGGEQTISYASTSGSGGSTFTWRPGFG